MWQLQITFFVILTLGVVSSCELNKPTRSFTFWVFAFVGLFVLSTSLLRQADRPIFVGAGRGTWTMAIFPMRLASVALIIFGGLLGLLAKRRRVGIAWLASSLMAIGGGCLCAKFLSPAQFERAVAVWPNPPVFQQFGEWVSRFDNQDAGLFMWCWPTPWIALPLIAIGFLRTLVRGYRQRRARELPVAWLLSFASIVLLFALLPISSHVAPIGLLWVVIMLSVFGIADLWQALIERLALPTPPTGPSQVPRV